MRTKIAVVGSATVMVLATAAPAVAEHPHVIMTPGTCVDRAGTGFGTGEQHDDTSFHERVHMGAPGTFAFTQEHNPVSIKGRTVCP